jgi:hypothetical protein
MGLFQHGFIAWGILAAYTAIFVAYLGWIRAVENNEATEKGGQ